MPLGRLFVKIASDEAPATVVMDKVVVLVCDALSLTCTVKA